MKKYLFGFIGIVAAVAAFASVPPGTVGGDDVNPRTRLVTNAWENAKGDIMAAMADGEARPLPRYLHALPFFDAYPAEAEAYYATLAEVGGGCSAVRDGNTLARNFDFPFDDRAEFVITMQPGAGRFASVGVANVGTNLTEAMVNSGKPEHSAKYKWLPGATTDGVNENGVAACINVVSSFGHTNGWHGATVHYLAAVRRVLDTATNAADAAADLAANVYVPQSALDRGYSFHYIVADPTATYIVEDGEARPYTGRVVMTNYRLFDPGEPYGTGRERAALLANPDADITEAWFTLAYEADTRPIRYSEFVAPGKNPTNEYDNAVASWANGARETHRGKGFWQSVHTSIYDLENLTLKIAVQEIPDFYTFAIPQGGKVKSVNGETGDVVLEAIDVGAVSSQGLSLMDGTQYLVWGSGNPIMEINPETPKVDFRKNGNYFTISPSSVSYNNGTAYGTKYWANLLTLDDCETSFSSASIYPPTCKAVANYLDSNYLTKSGIAQTYYTKSAARSDFDGITNYVNSSLTDYRTKGDLDYSVGVGWTDKPNGWYGDEVRFASGYGYYWVIWDDEHTQRISSELWQTVEAASNATAVTFRSDILHRGEIKDRIALNGDLSGFANRAELNNYVPKVLPMDEATIYIQNNTATNPFVRTWLNGNKQQWGDLAHPYSLNIGFGNTFPQTQTSYRRHLTIGNYSTQSESSSCIIIGNWSENQSNNSLGTTIIGHEAVNRHNGSNIVIGSGARSQGDNTVSFFNDRTGVNYSLGSVYLGSTSLDTLVGAKIDAAITPEEDPYFSAWTNETNIALGNKVDMTSARNAVAIGPRAVANSYSTVAVGNDANIKRSTRATAIGYSAHITNATEAAQINIGENNVARSLKFRGTTVVDGNGQIPVAELDTPVRSVYDDSVYAVANGLETWNWNEQAFNGVVPQYGVARANTWSVNLPTGYTFDGGATAVVEAPEETVYLAFIAQHGGGDVLITAKLSKPAPVATGDKFVKQSKVNEIVSANLNTYVDGETGIEYVGKYYGGNLYYVPTGNVYPPNN